MLDGEHMASHNQYPEQTEENLLRTNPHYDYEALVNGQVPISYLDAKVSPAVADSLVPTPNGGAQVGRSKRLF